MTTPNNPSTVRVSSGVAGDIAAGLLKQHDSFVLPMVTQLAQMGVAAYPSTTSRVIQEDNAAELRRQIDKLSGQLEELRARKSDKAELRQELDAVQASVEAVRHAEQQLTAPVYLPASEDMAVRLVSAGVLDSLQEHQSDYNVYLTLTGAFAGLAGGLALAPLVTPVVSFSTAYGPVLACLSIVTLIFGVRAWIMNGRIRSTRRRMLGSGPVVPGATAPAKPAPTPQAP